MASKVTKAGGNEEDGPSKRFAESLLPLYHGPFVKLRVASSDREHTVSVSLLRKKSRYFEAMFREGPSSFEEGIERKATLVDIDGVVSARSLAMLIEWVYCEKVIFQSETADEKISELLEFVRIADMWGVHGMEQTMADELKTLIEKVAPKKRLTIILPKHVLSASSLPSGHPIRAVMAKAIARSFFEDKNKVPFPFFDELSRFPALCTDIITEMRTIFYSASATVTRNDSSSAEVRVEIKFSDPLCYTPAINAIQVKLDCPLEWRRN